MWLTSAQTLYQDMVHSFFSLILLGEVGISNMVHKIADHEYMGFENICKYGP